MRLQMHSHSITKYEYSRNSDVYVAHHAQAQRLGSCRTALRQDECGLNDASLDRLRSVRRGELRRFARTRRDGRGAQGDPELPGEGGRAVGTSVRALLPVHLLRARACPSCNTIHPACTLMARLVQIVMRHAVVSPMLPTIPCTHAFPLFSHAGWSNGWQMPSPL